MPAPVWCTKFAWTCLLRVQRCLQLHAAVLAVCAVLLACAKEQCHQRQQHLVAELFTEAPYTQQLQSGTNKKHDLVVVACPCSS